MNKSLPQMTQPAKRHTMRSEVKFPYLVNNKMYDYGIGMDPISLNADNNRISTGDNGSISIISSGQLDELNHNNNNIINTSGANSVSNRLYYSDSFRLLRAKVKILFFL